MKRYGIDSGVAIRLAREGTVRRHRELHERAGRHRPLVAVRSTLTGEHLATNVGG